MMTPAKARLIVEYGHITNTPVSQEIIDISHMGTVDQLSLGPFSNTLVGHSRDALQHCLDNPAHCVLINPNTYDALSVALCDAYLSDKEGQVIILTPNIKKIAKIIEKYNIGKVYTSLTDSVALDDADFIVTNLHDFYEKRSYQENVKMIISMNETYSYHTTAVSSQATSLSEYDRVIFIEHITGLLQYGEYDIFTALATSNYMIYHIIKNLGTIPNNFDKMNAAELIVNSAGKPPIIDMCRLVGVFYPKVKNIGFFSSPMVRESIDSLKYECDTFVNSSYEARRQIIDKCMLDNNYLSKKKETITNACNLLKTSGNYTNGIIFRTSNEKLATTLGASMSIPVIDGSNDDHERAKIARFLYPDPSYKLYNTSKRNIFSTKTIFCSSDILDNEDILNKCTMMVYCEPFADRESFLLEYELCRLYNISMFFILVSGTYEEYLPEKGWFA